MRKYALILLFTLISVSIGAQNKISFAYDSCGNRINRTILLQKSSVSATIEPFVEIIDKREIKIYPNPTHGQVKVEILNHEDIKSCTITINSLGSGKLIIKKKATLPLTEIDLSTQPNGLYVMVINIDGEKVSWKIIKQ